jgi:hypothetical protein
VTIGTAVFTGPAAVNAMFDLHDLMRVLLTPIGRTKVTRIIIGFQLADGEAERHATARLVAVDRSEAQSPPTGLRAVAALCSAPRPGPLAASAA